MYNNRDFWALSKDDKCSFVEMLALLVLNMYRYYEHKFITNPNKQGNNKKYLLKGFQMDQFPFTFWMNKAIRMDAQFRVNNSHIDLKEYFRINDNKKCTDLGERLSLNNKFDNNIIIIIVLIPNLFV